MLCIYLGAHASMLVLCALCIVRVHVSVCYVGVCLGAHASIKGSDLPYREGVDTGWRPPPLYIVGRGPEVGP